MKAQVCSSYWADSRPCEVLNCSKAKSDFAIKAWFKVALIEAYVQMATILITGSSRGIGLELVKQMLSLPTSEIAKIFAVTRARNSAGLQHLLGECPDRLSNIIIEDLSNESQAQNAAKEVEAALQGQGLDILVNNAGMAVANPNGIRNMTSSELLDVFNANVVSTQTMTTTFLPLLQRGCEKKVINVQVPLQIRSSLVLC